MKDYFDNELVLGDDVAFCQPRYRNLIMGKIIKFTPQKVKVEYKYQERRYTYIGEPSFFIKKTRT